MLFNQFAPLDLMFGHEIHNSIGILLKMTVISTSLLLPFLPLFLIYAQLDPFYYVFEGCILPHVYQRTILTIIMAPIVRFFLTFICVVEFARFSLFSVLCFTPTQLVSLSFLRHISRLTKDGLTTSKHVHRNYIELRYFPHCSIGSDLFYSFCYFTLILEQ